LSSQIGFRRVERLKRSSVTADYPPSLAVSPVRPFADSLPSLPSSNRTCGFPGCGLNLNLLWIDARFVSARDALARQTAIFSTAPFV